MRFYGSHAGHTALLVGNGENLLETPPHWFRYPSFGMNTICKHEGWMPTYYTAVDDRVRREFGREIGKKYRDVPKFIPTPNLDKWQGENFYRFHHRTGAFLTGSPLRPELLTDGIRYGNIMHVAIQLAAWMGFTTLLMIGVSHKPDRAQAHFWGWDDGMHDPPVDQWFGEYAELVRHLKAYGVSVLNISPDTYVPQEVLPRGDWREWRNDES